MPLQTAIRSPVTSAMRLMTLHHKLEVFAQKGLDSRDGVMELVGDIARWCKTDLSSHLNFGPDVAGPPAWHLCAFKLYSEFRFCLVNNRVIGEQMDSMSDAAIDSAVTKSLDDFFGGDHTDYDATVRHHTQLLLGRYNLDRHLAKQPASHVCVPNLISAFIHERIKLDDLRDSFNDEASWGKEVSHYQQLRLVSEMVIDHFQIFNTTNVSLRLVACIFFYVLLVIALCF